MSSEKHTTHAHAEPHRAADEKKADHQAACEAHKERFNHACQTVANGIATLKNAGCTPQEAQHLALQLWEKTKAG